MFVMTEPTQIYSVPPTEDNSIFHSKNKKQFQLDQPAIKKKDILNGSLLNSFWKTAGPNERKPRHIVL